MILTCKREEKKKTEKVVEAGRSPPVSPQDHSFRIPATDTDADPKAFVLHHLSKILLS